MNSGMISVYKQLELQIGLTDACNLKCRMCMQTAHSHGVYGKQELKLDPLHGGKTGFMEKALFNKVIRDLSASNLYFRFILLHWLGESLLHPQFKEMLEQLSIASKHDFFDELMLYTNCTLLEPDLFENAGQILEQNGKNLIIVFSIDASTSETFLRLKGSPEFTDLVEKIKNLVSMKLPGLRYVFRFLVLPENSHETEDFVVYWTDFLKSISEKACITFNEEKPRYCDSTHMINLRRAAGYKSKELEDLHRKIVCSLGLAKKQNKRIIDFGDTLPGSGKRPPCAAPFRTPIIHWDGRVTVCCSDSELELEIGNVMDCSFPNIFLGSKANALRTSHLSDKELPERCQRCGNVVGLGLSDEQISELKGHYC